MSNPNIVDLIEIFLDEIESGQLTKSEMEEVIQKCQEAIKKYYGK